ncbi:MAG: acyl-CoA thioesterase [Phycisphaerae bacterium]
MAAFRINRNVTFAETDMAGVMHFSNYYRWMEEVEHALWRSLGMSVVKREAGEDDALSWPRVRTNCEYFKPARFEDALELSIAVSAIGRKSLSFLIEFKRNDETLARGESVCVCCRMKDGVFRSVEIPEAIREKLLSIAS